MKAIHLTSLKPLKNSQFWLLGIGAGLIAIHLSLTDRANNPSLLGISVLFWSAVASLVWQKRHRLNLESGVFSSVIGALIVSFVLLKSLSFSGYDFFLRISPFISALGLSLLASGTKGLKQYWQELLSLSFLIVSPGILSSLIEPSIFTAKFAAFILWYSGFKVSVQGVYISLPTGGVEVYSGCSGIENMTHLLGLAMLFLVMFPPTNWLLKILVALVAISLAFVVNGIRVAVMTVLAASSNQQAFEYWHFGEGSLIFSLVSVLIFGLFCLFLLKQEKTDNLNSAGVEKQ